MSTDAAKRLLPACVLTYVHVVLSYASLCHRAVVPRAMLLLQDVSTAMRPRLSTSFNVMHLNALRVGRAAINATFSTLQRRLLHIDPYLPIDTQVRGC